VTDYRDDSLDLLHVDPTPEDPSAWCHWTDCPLDEGHDGPHDSPQCATA
jgi:hypothetical protein